MFVNPKKPGITMIKIFAIEFTLLIIAIILLIVL